MSFPVAQFRNNLARWFESDARNLPWRTLQTPYRTVVSEFMLQQTQVATVIPYFERWMRRFPDFATLAAATEDDVVHAWQGLGYYSRARNLHRLAMEVSRRAALPTTAREWQQLPGIGPYSAAAIASIAFNEPVAVVDGNVVRILSRIFGDTTPLRPEQAVRHFQESATQLLDVANPGRHNEAMMELGATVCVRRNPLCVICPVRGMCAAAGSGQQNEIPALLRKSARKVVAKRLWIKADGHILLVRYSSTAKRLAGIVELPTPEDLPFIRANTRPIATFKRGISNESITEKIIQVPAVRVPPVLPEAPDGKALFWAPIKALGSITISGPHRQWIKSLLEMEQTTAGTG